MQGTATPRSADNRKGYKVASGANTATISTASSFILKTNFCSRS